MRGLAVAELFTTPMHETARACRLCVRLPRCASVAYGWNPLQMDLAADDRHAVVRAWHQPRPCVEERSFEYEKVAPEADDSGFDYNTIRVTTIPPPGWA